jgi:hypothetical protein
MLEIGALIDAKVELSTADPPWDLFISSYNDSERVKSMFERVPAVERHWWVMPEYRYQRSELPDLPASAFLPDGDEADIIKAGLAAVGFDPSRHQRLLFDITGMMRPHILFMMAYLADIGVDNFDLLYTEPEQYARKADTVFSIGEDIRVVTVNGYVGAHNTDTSGDVLVVGIGYDHHLISHVLQAKEGARVVQLHSFPSLSADMYHESILRFDKVRSEEPRSGDEVYYSSANDPFVTAASLETAIGSVDTHQRISNLYLSPLATKPQAVGFGLHYLRNLRGRAASIVYPSSPRYSRETTTGVGRSWIYPIHLDA